MRRVYFYIAIGMAGLVACNSNNNTKNEKATAPVPPAAVRSMLNDTGTEKLVTVITKYYALKNALVATSEDNTGAASSALSSAAVDMQGYLLKKDGMPGPLKPFLDTIIMQTRAIGEIKDKTCEPQRLAFSTISSSIYGLIKSAELRNMNVYHQFCPMAFNEKGATWLSSESDIKNPYFGDKMLECGEVTDSIK